MEPAILVLLGSTLTVAVIAYNTISAKRSENPTTNERLRVNLARWTLACCGVMAAVGSILFVRSRF